MKTHWLYFDLIHFTVRDCFVSMSYDLCCSLPVEICFLYLNQTTIPYIILPVGNIDGCMNVDDFKGRGRLEKRRTDCVNDDFAFA